MYDLIVIGAGAAGLMAAGRASELGLKVLITEKMEKPGRKLRITGKGRCNITNTRDHDEFVAKIRNGAEFAEVALRNFDNRKTTLFLSSIDLPITVERGGRVFPTSGKAWDVANAIEYWAKDNGAEFRCNCEVKAVELEEGVITGVRLANGEVIATKSVLIATGGASYPRTGSTGDGYVMAAEMGHTIEPLRPALIPLEINEPLEPFKGLDLKNTGVKLLIDGVVTEEHFGDVEFTDKALGGATILQLSRSAVDAIIEERLVEIVLDLKPALDHRKLRFRIDRDIEALGETAPLRALLDRLTPRPLHNKITRHCALALRKESYTLDSEQRDELVKTLKHLSFGITDYRPFEEAIVTAGGVSLKEVNPKTMESTIVKKLYFAGELLDIDADTGGYNIQLALSTARLAAEAAATAAAVKVEPKKRA